MSFAQEQCPKCLTAIVITFIKRASPKISHFVSLQLAFGLLAHIHPNRLLSVLPVLMKTVSSLNLEFASVDVTSHRLKIFRKQKNPESSQKQNLNLSHSGNYLHSIYIILGISRNLEMFQRLQKDVCSLYANSMLFYMRNLSILGF